MQNTQSNERDAFIRMAREFPLRTGIFTFGLPAFAFFQLLICIVYGGSLLFIAAFAALTVVYSVQLTRYHLAVYRREKLDQYW